MEKKLCFNGRVVGVRKSNYGRSVRIICEESFILNFTQSINNSNFFKYEGIISEGDEVEISIRRRDNED